MELIEGVELSRLCDYSFGDQSGQWGNIYTSFMKEANLLNLEFVEKVFEIKKIKNSNSVSIGIRLYELLSKDLLSKVGGITSKEFYKKSVSAILKKISQPKFFLFSLFL